MKNKKSAKKTMTFEQVEELNDAENLFLTYREDLTNYRVNLREAERDTREAQANLKKEKNLLAKTEKDVAAAKKSFDKLKTKYKGWAKPKPDASPARHYSSGVQVREGMP